MVVSPDLLAGLIPFPFAVGQMVTPLRFALISIAIDLVLSVSGSAWIPGGAGLGIVESHPPG
jgi:hypothetical protein